MADVSVPLKCCSRKHHCLHLDGPELPATAEYFHRDKKSKDGITHICKVCACAKTQEWRTVPGNAERDRAKSRQWNAENKVHRRAYVAENAARIALQKRAWRQSNPSKVKKHKRDSRIRNRDTEKERIRRHYARFPERRRLNTRVQQHRRRHADGTFTKADIALQLKTQGSKCWWCDNALNGDYHIDHRIPLARGGSNDPSNLCIACPTCNMSKGAKLPHEWNGRLL